MAGCLASIDETTLGRCIRDDTLPSRAIFQRQEVDGAFELSYYFAVITTIAEIGF